MKHFSQTSESPKKFERRTLSDGVYDALCDALMAGEYPPSTRLTIRSVAEKVGTSAMPVREAFHRLCGEGILEPLPNGMTRVPVLDEEKLIDLTDIRLEVEGLAAARAATRMSKYDCDALHRANQEGLKAAKIGDTISEVRANGLFHFTLYNAAQSDELLRIIQRLWLRVGPFLLLYVTAQQSKESTKKRKPVKSVGVEYHKRIIKAVKEKDSDGARTALREDIKEGRDFLINFSKGLDENKIRQIADAARS